MMRLGLLVLLLGTLILPEEEQVSKIVLLDGTSVTAVGEVILENNMLAYRDAEGRRTLLSKGLVQWEWTRKKSPQIYLTAYPEEASQWLEQGGDRGIQARANLERERQPRREIVIDNDAIASLPPNRGLVSQWQPEEPEGKDPTLAQAASKPEDRTPIIKTITHGERVVLSSHLEPQRYVAFDFYADWCGPCRQLTPRLESLVHKYPGKVALKKVDIVRWGTPVATQYKVNSIPYVRVYGPDGAEIFAGNGFSALQLLENRAQSEGW